MALIKCPECSHDVSTKASECPNCGFPVSKKINEWASTNDVKKNENKIICPKCHSRNINVVLQSSANISKTKTETHKKSIITRAGNSLGRTAMIAMTGGIWAITPKKSKYQEISLGSSYAINKKIAICQDCGESWKI